MYGTSGSWSDYSHPNHEPIFADELTFTPEQQALCGDSLQCLYDLSQTGSEEIAMDTMLTEETNEQDQLISRMLVFSECIYQLLFIHQRTSHQQ